MEQNLPREANSHSSSKEIPSLLWNPCSQQPATGPYPEPDASNTHLPTLLP